MKSHTKAFQYFIQNKKNTPHGLSPSRHATHSVLCPTVLWVDKWVVRGGGGWGGTIKFQFRKISLKMYPYLGFAAFPQQMSTTALQRDASSEPAALCTVTQLLHYPGQNSAATWNRPLQFGSPTRRQTPAANLFPNANMLTFTASQLECQGSAKS